MEDLKHRAGEKLEAFHVAAVTAAGNSKSRVQDAYYQTSDTIQRIHTAFLELWNHELILESRAAISAWTREAVRRVKEGAPPLSPVLLYEELLSLFQDRVWRRTMLVFACGVVVGGSAGLAAGLRARQPAPRGPHARALHTQPDHAVILVDDHVTPCAGWSEVLVRVQAFSVCPLDRRVLRGRGAGLRALLHARNTPVTAGRAFAGVVLDVGGGVSDLELGDEVWGTVSEWSGGAASELLTIPSTRVSRRPRPLAADGAASLVWGGALALRALAHLKYDRDSCKGKRVAVCGACTGEGCAALQLLASWGAAPTAVGPHHAAQTLNDLGSHEYVECSEGLSPFAVLEARAARAGPWDAVLAFGDFVAQQPHPDAILKATAPRSAFLDLRPRALWSDRLPAPLHVFYAATFYTYRILRWCVGLGSHTDWLEDEFHLRESLDTLAALVDAGHVTAALDKVYLPQEFETALAHACSDEAIGTTVISLVLDRDNYEEDLKRKPVYVTPAEPT